MADVIEFSDLPVQIQMHFVENKVSRVVKWNGIHGPTYLVGNQWGYYDVWIALDTCPKTWAHSPAASYFS